MLPVTPATRPARPQRSTSRKSPGHNEGAIEAANRSANPMSARHMAARANRNKQRSLLPDGQCLARSVTKLGLRQSIMKDNDQIQITTLRRVAAASQPHEIPQPQHLATEISPQLDGPTLMGKGESLSSVMHTPIKEAAIPRKPLRVYRNAAKRQALERRDVYQLPEDESNESNQLIEEPMTSNFQDPSNESAPTSPESETLEQCLRRSLHAKQASDEAQSDTSDDTGASVLEGGNDKAVEEDEEDDRILDGQEARNEIADDARSNTSSQRTANLLVS
ncbi:hypothetical protein BDZ45DRAFT_400482 [Acephala macrosclerotiorum]|nr:hypothetical protein BDZ45DRAFT_400482 [Acephala macrosclerotiorum]